MSDDQNGKLIPVEDVMARVVMTLDGVWKRLSEERPDLANQLATAAGDLQKLAVAMDQLGAMLGGALATADELRKQRDDALDKLVYLEPNKRNQALRDLAKYISWDSSIPPQDVERVLEILSGDSDLWVSEYTKDDFFAALRQFAQEAFEEAAYQAEVEDEE